MFTQSPSVKQPTHAFVVRLQNLFLLPEEQSVSSKHDTQRPSKRSHFGKMGLVQFPSLMHCTHFCNDVSQTGFCDPAQSPESTHPTHAFFSRSHVSVGAVQLLELRQPTQSPVIVLQTGLGSKQSVEFVLVHCWHVFVSSLHIGLAESQSDEVRQPVIHVPLEQYEPKGHCPETPSKHVWHIFSWVLQYGVFVPVTLQ